MSGRTEVSTTLQDPNVESAGSKAATIALIGPNATHRRVMAQALGNSDARAVREFVDYPANLGDIPHLMEEGFDVVMIDVDSDQSYALQIIESIAGYNSAIVMAYSMRNDPDLIRDCMRAGARDFLPLPEEAGVEAGLEAEPEVEAAVQPEPEPEPEPQALAEPALNPADFLRSPQAVVAEEKEEAPFNPADFLLPSARGGASPGSFTPPAPEDYAVPSRPQFVEPRKTAATQPVPPPVEARRPDPVMPPVEARRPDPVPPVEARRPDPAPVKNVQPEELRRPVPPSKPQESTQSTEPKNEDEFNTWDSMWIHPALAGAGKPVENGAGAAPETSARKKPAIVSGPQLVQRAAAAAAAVAPRVEPEPAPAPAVAAPLFRHVEPEPSSVAQRPWMRYALIGGVPLVVIGLILLIFLPSHKSSIPAAPPAQPASQTQAEPTSASPVTPFVNDAKPGAKPSAATPVGQDPSQPAPVSSKMMDAQLNAPSRISLKKQAQQSDETPGSFAPGAIDGGGALPGQVFGNSHEVKVVAGVSAISAGVAEGMLVHKTAPVYPEIAKAAHVGGTVVLGANITKSGALTNLHVLSGPTMLRNSAMDAVKTWHYRPYLLDNQPVEVETTIRVVFSLQSR